MYIKQCTVQFQSTRPLRGATGQSGTLLPQSRISIHAPLAGRDILCVVRIKADGYFNPRAPCGARRPCCATARGYWVFQSTRPLRGATRSAPASYPTPFNFNPRAPCGARRNSQRWSARSATFQSTRPLRGATAYGVAASTLLMISIHAPLAGRDLRARLSSSPTSEFQSTRPLRGATPVGYTIEFRATDFNPRAPCGARPSLLA